MYEHKSAHSKTRWLSGSMLKLILFQCQEFIDSRVVGARTRNCSFPVKVKAVDLKAFPSLPLPAGCTSTSVPLLVAFICNCNQPRSNASQGSIAINITKLLSSSMTQSFFSRTGMYAITCNSNSTQNVTHKVKMAILRPFLQIWHMLGL